MAKIGLNSFRYAKLLNPTAAGAPLYDQPKSPGKAVSCEVEIENYDAELYADDVLVESDKSFKKGTATMTIDDEDLATMADLLGHTMAGGKIIRNAYDAAPFVGFGRIVVKLVNNVRKYKVEFLNKVKFSEPNAENQTKGEDIEFGLPEIEGTVTALLNGDWSSAKEFDTRTEALTYLEGLMGTGVTLTYNAHGGTGSIAPLVAAKNSSVTLSDGTGLTAPEGKGFLGWGTTAATTTPDITSPYTITENKTIYAIWTNLATLTYDSNGGTGSIDSITKPAGSAITLSDGTGLTHPTNKTFGGWVTSASGTEVVTSPYTLTADTTLYAKWDT